MINGMINVYKEQGFTSHDVVAKLRGILKQKKIGHTGTLDPDAQGVLPVCLGKATKVCDLLTNHDKTYAAELLLGVETDTQDISGTVLCRKEVAVKEEELRQIIAGFVGEYEQIPPMYSALKVNGRKLYELARSGIEVERQPRKVMIHSIIIKEIQLPVVKMEVHCSKGTYIRTLCHDIGQKAGCCGCMQKLVRTQAGIFGYQESHRLEEIQQLADQGRIAELIIPIDSLFLQYPVVHTKESCKKQAYNGNPLAAEQCIEQLSEKGTIRLYDAEDQFIGIYQWKEQHYVPMKIFWETK